MSARPDALPIKFGGIPVSLMAIHRWILWKHDFIDGRWSKVPYQVSGYPASTTNPKHWSTFNQAADELMFKPEFDGLGIIITGEDFHGIDLDDCRDPDTEELSQLARDLLEHTKGYAEVSPSGTGIKMFTPTNLDRSRTKKEVGVELYTKGRYFTVTGHQLNGHSDMAETCQDMSWFVEKVWNDGTSSALLDPNSPLTTRTTTLSLADLRTTLNDWPLERVREEVMPHLDPDVGYGEWLSVGAALHHQGEGVLEWLEMWDEWSSLSAKYGDGECETKWSTFKPQRAGGSLTLATLLKQTKDKRTTAEVDVLKKLFAEIEATTMAKDLELKIAKQIVRLKTLTDIDREDLAAAIQKKAQTLGTKLPIAIVRGWLVPKFQGSFLHLNEKGHPIYTIENFKVLMGKLGVHIRYNVIKKTIDILIPEQKSSSANKDNASIAYLMSECEKHRFPPRNVLGFVMLLADANPYNPVMTWIESKPWDGVGRVQAYYDTVKSSSPTEMKELFMYKWALQAIAAAYDPFGIAAQGILTFTGAQNIGKTTWFQRLAPKESKLILTGHTLDTKSKDSMLTAVSHWIVELGEVGSTMKKSEMNALKAFITQNSDSIRRPYAMTESVFARQTVFGASVNDTEYLSDPTGNRRFWTIEVEEFERDHQVDMQQLWAEFLSLYMRGERSDLDATAIGMLNEQNENHTTPDSIYEILAVNYDWESSNHDHWEWLTAAEVFNKLHPGGQPPNRGESTRVGNALRKLMPGKEFHRKTNGLIKHFAPTEGKK